MPQDLGFEAKTDREMVLDLAQRLARVEQRLATLERGDAPFKRQDTPQYGPQTT